MVEARPVKFCTKGDYIKSCQRDDKSTADLEKILHSTLLPEINNVVDDGLLFIAPRALEATLRLRAKLHQFHLSLYLLQTCLYNI